MTTPSLSELQQNFNRALHYQSNGEACDIVSDHFTAEERVQIYRNNFIISLSEVLQAAYPMVLALVGEECFAQMARQHVLNNPLLAGDVSHYGADFSATIELFSAVTEAAPYCVEVARFEWTIDESIQRRDQNSPNSEWLPLAKLAEVDPSLHEHLQFHLADGVIAFESQYAVYSLKQAIEANQFEQLTLETGEQGVVVSLSSGEQWTQSLEPEAFALLIQIQSGKVLAEIPPELLAQLNRLIESQLIAGFTLRADCPK